MKERVKKLSKLRSIKFTKKRVVFGIIILLLVGVGIWWKFFRVKNGLKEGRIERGDVTEELVLSGKVEATEHAELGFESSGKMVFVGVKEGEKIKKGKLLGKLDTVSLNAAYQQALSSLRKYDATVENVHDQVKNHSSDETYAQKDSRTTAEATKDSAYEAVVIAKRNLEAASLFSPIDGVVTYAANSFPGVFVIYSQKQFEVVNPETIYFSVSADQTEVIQLTKGQKVEVTLDSFSERTIEGTILDIGYAPNPEEVGVSYEIKIGLTGVEIEYRLGMTGDAGFIIGQAKDVLWVKNTFVKSDKQGKYVLIEKGKKKKYIEVGVEGEDRVEVTGEIKEGETVYDD